MAEASPGRARRKETVLGLVERGGKIRRHLGPRRHGVKARSAARRADAMIFTDDWPPTTASIANTGHHRIDH